jgi:hypothetical protein
MLLLAASGLLALVLAGPALPGPAPTTSSPTDAAVRPERVVFLAGDLAEEDLIAFTANAVASGHPGVVLRDGPRCSRGLRGFLSAFGPERLIAVGPFPAGTDDLERRLGIRPTLLAWDKGPSDELWKTWFARAEQVVVCPAQPRRLLLQAACLAGTMRAPLWVVHPNGGNLGELRRLVAQWRTRRVLAAGLDALARELPSVHVIHLPDTEAVAALHQRQLAQQGSIETLVVTNPADTRRELTGMSMLAPFVALRHRAALVFTADTGDNTAAAVREALRSPRMRSVEHLILVADPKAIPMEQRPNPVPGKDPVIEMEPLTPSGAEPFSFAIGRLFHDDPGILLLMLARQRLLDDIARDPAGRPRKALVVSNPGGGLPLLEVFSRSTTRELRNCGYQTTVLCGDEVSRAEVRRLLPQHDIFLWEGHHSTLIKDYGFADWTEPLPPSLTFLQSCLALTDAKTHHLFERGSVAVVGSSTRIYSATGGAFSLAYFNALLYDGRSLGASLRHAKNFLVAYALLKEKRLGKSARLTGANLRSAWAFTLWGDPTLKLPAPPVPAESLSPVRTEVRGNTIVVSVPETPHPQMRTDRYLVGPRPNMFLAGLLTSAEDPKSKALVPFVFTEVALPRGPLHQTPRLRSRLPASHYVFCWDARRRTGYLLVLPHSRAEQELRFYVEWETPSAEAALTSAALAD